MEFELDILAKDAWTVFALRVDGKNEVQEYLDTLGKRRRDEHGALMKAMELFAEKGPSSSKEKFRLERDGVFALKAHQQRAYGFYGGERDGDRYCFIVCVCDEKKKDKADPKILQRACDLKSEFEKTRKIKK